MNTKHVPDLEHCQELDRLCKEKGIVMPWTEYQWQIGGKLSGETTATLVPTNRPPTYGSADSAWRFIPAPLVSEQGKWLPNERRDKLAFFSGLAINGWFCEVKNYRVMPYERFHVILQEDTEANARMKCLLYLLENDIIDGNAFN